MRLPKWADTQSRCPHAQSMDVDEDLDQNLDLARLDTSACLLEACVSAISTETGL